MNVPTCEGCQCEDPTTKYRPVWGLCLCWGCEIYLGECVSTGDTLTAQEMADYADATNLKGAVV